MSSLWSRVAVAALGVPLVLGLAWAGGWWLFSFVAIAALVALHEYTLMTRTLRPVVLAGYGSVLLTLLGAELGGLPWMLGGMLATLLLSFGQFVVSSTRQPATVAIGSTFLGVGWIGGGLGCLLLIREIPEHGQLALLTVLLAVWAADSAAYGAGRLLGRHKLSPVLSPGKTWEGFVAGVLAAVAVAFFALYPETDGFLSVGEALLLGGVIAVAEALGDLFESALKRDMEIKDSGRLLGGHGGMLDRIDSLLFAGPAALFLIAAFLT